MSKLRQQIPIDVGEASGPTERDLAAYVIFTQLKDGAPVRYAGWLDAADDAMATQFAREHYGRDEPCVALWAIPRGAITGSDGVGTANHATHPRATYRVFVQTLSPDDRRAEGTVEATSSAEALELAHAQAPADAQSVWVAPEERILISHDADVIWKNTDQTYRLARGYSKEVRAKWQTIREQSALEEYERDDLKEAF